MKDYVMVGRVPLVLDYYSGNDEYSDGDIEDYLLSLVKMYGDIDYNSIIAANPSWPLFYHLSAFREDIIGWYPFSGNERVLEVGAGCGAVTGCLTKNCGTVDAIDLSKRRCLINAYRHRSTDNLTVYASNFQDFAVHTSNKYSLITLIGVFEYSKLYISSSDPFVDFLKRIQELLTSDGTIIIAIENRLGLKYFAGCREDHLGTFFSGIEGYGKERSACTFSRSELLEVCEAAGFSNWRFYYPYPDYKFPVRIYSDDYLPKIGELTNNLRNFDLDRYVLFDENQAFDGIISAKLFPEFSNSFLLEIKR